MMTLGNLLLERFEVSKDPSFLEKAVTRYEEALSLVLSLEKMNLDDKSFDTESEISFRGIALLICRGRAQYNLAKTYFEQGEVYRSSARQQFGSLNGSVTFLWKASKYLKQLEGTTKDLRGKLMGLSDLRSMVQKVETYELESLGCCLHGLTLWRLSKIETCFEMLMKASESHWGKELRISSIKADSIICESMFRLFAEQYKASCLSVEIAQSIFFSSVRSGFKRTLEDAFFLKAMNDGYVRACTVIDLFNEMSSKPGSPKSFNDLKLEHDIMGKEELTNIQRNDNNRFKKLMSQKPEELTTSPKPFTKLLQRNDLFHDRHPYNDIQQKPTALIVVDGRLSQKRSTGTSTNRRVETDDGFDGFDIHSRDLEDSTIIASDEVAASQKLRYRKWGDELLIASGKSITAFPSCEPDKPLEMTKSAG